VRLFRLMCGDCLDMRVRPPTDAMLLFYFDEMSHMARQSKCCTFVFVVSDACKAVLCLIKALRQE
jgi:hypothetical protein